MERIAPLSDLITGTVLYNKMVDDILAEETDMTATDWRILFFLIEGADRRARIRTLSEALILSNSTISDAAKDLASRNLASKVGNDSDLKAIWVAATPAGEEAFARVNAILLEETREYWEILGEAVSENYFANGMRLLSHWGFPVESIGALPKAVSYPFICRRYLLSFSSWFKSTYNLGLVDVRILLVLLEHGKKMTCTDIAHLLRISNSTVSNSVRHLSRIKRYVSRMRETSGHGVKVVLTEDGATRIREIRERFIQFNMDQFGFTRDEFHTMLLKVHPRRRKSYMQRVFGEDFMEE